MRWMAKDEAGVGSCRALFSVDEKAVSVEGVGEE